MSQLRSAINTPATEKKILREAKNRISRHVAAFYEHHQWWIEDKKTFEIYAVVDCRSQVGVDYFGFEQVSSGDSD